MSSRNMIDIQLEPINLSQIEKKLGRFKRKAPDVLTRAINRTVTSVKANMAKETSSMFYVKSGDVKKTIKTVKANKGNIQAYVKSNGERTPLIKFKVSPKSPAKRRGGKMSPSVYKAGVRKDTGMKPLNGNPKPFISTIFGHTNVFQRLKSSRFPVRIVRGPAVPQMINNKNVIDAINKNAKETLRKRIDAEVNHILQKG